VEELANRSDPFLELRPLIDQVRGVAEPRAQVRIVDGALRQQADELRKVLKVAPVEVEAEDVGVEGEVRAPQGGVAKDRIDTGRDKGTMSDACDDVEVAGYTPGMKTAVSVPDDVFERADRLARRAGRSRSEVYSAALREYLARHTPDEVTEALDRIVGEIGEGLDPFTREAGRRGLAATEW